MLITNSVAAREIRDVSLRHSLTELAGRRAVIDLWTSGFVVAATVTSLGLSPPKAPLALEFRCSRNEVIDAIKSALDNAGIEIPCQYRTLTFKGTIPIEVLTSGTSAT